MDPELEKIRHSCSHILADAVKKLFPKVKLGIGPAIDDGFYYDFDYSEGFTPADLEKIEAEMKKIVESNAKFEKKEITKAEAKKLFKNEPYKLELLKEIEKPTIYKHGDFVDLCAGPHVNYTKKCKAFKLMKTAGAYWKGDSKNKQLQRIYGIAFGTKKEVDDYLTLLEEAEKRNHIKLGKELGLYSFHEEAPGMPFFHNKGNFIWESLVSFVRAKMIERNYEINKTPMILNKALWLQSGHWDHYKDNMYFTQIDKQDYAVKPMNCPGNILIYKTGLHSYRELPIRAGEFGLVHRHELSGVLNGLFRVRMFTQDDAHVFCMEEQIKDEVMDLINFCDEVYSTFGFEYHIELSTKPKKAMGDPKLWELAENKLKEVLDENGKKYKINEGDGAFYGPKIDFHLKDALGRTWQCGTIQLDFQMPEKFDLTYEGQDGKKHRPVMLHRTILGSVERFLGILVEHYGGKFPLWISPVQVKIMTLSEDNVKFAKEIMDKMKENGLRVELDDRNESIPRKVRDAQLEKVNYMITIGNREVSEKKLAVRTRDGKVEFGVDVDEFISKLLEEIKEKR